MKNKPKRLLELNPYAKVPVLVDDGGVIYESAIINEYLDEKFPDLPLLPKDHLRRAKVRIWIDFFNSRVHPAASDLSRAREPEQARARLDGHLAALDQELGDKEFVLGDYSLADVSFVPFYVRRARYGVRIDEAFPNLKSWGERLIARPAVSSTL